MLGNALYNGTAGSYSHFHNWFFVVQDPFGIFDPKLSPYIMPFFNIAVFFAVEMAVYAVYTALTKRKGRETSEM